jgi:hypothetical protein
MWPGTMGAIAGREAVAMVPRAIAALCAVKAEGETPNRHRAPNTMDDSDFVDIAFINLRQSVGDRNF